MHYIWYFKSHLVRAITLPPMQEMWYMIMMGNRIFHPCPILTQTAVWNLWAWSLFVQQTSLFSFNVVVLECFKTIHTGQSPDNHKLSSYWMISYGYIHTLFHLLWRPVDTMIGQFGDSMHGSTPFPKMYCKVGRATRSRNKSLARGIWWRAPRVST